MQFIFVHPLFESERVQDFFSRKNLKQLNCIGPATEGFKQDYNIIWLMIEFHFPSGTFRGHFGWKKDAYKPLNLAK